ncbi:MAG: serine/threonine protein kinase [Proteobacteria bacterium]|nr:serine/threonine protein kinase [Pseudomonadota bacterium]
MHEYRSAQADPTDEVETIVTRGHSAPGMSNAIESTAPRERMHVQRSSRFPTRADEVIYVHGVQRLRLCVAFFAILSLLSAIGGWTLPQSNTAKLVLGIATGLTFLISVPLWWLMRDPNALRRWHSTVFAFACVVAIMSAAYYFGPLSAAVSLIPLGTFAFAQSEDHLPSGKILIGLVTIYVALSTLVMYGVLADGAVTLYSGVSATDRLVLVVPVVIIFIGAHVIGRQITASGRELLDRHEAALRDLARRQALLDEARMELEEALQAGGTGRYSGLTVGSFDLGNLIGRGAMGEVYEGQHRGTGESAAIKLLRPESSANPRLVQRFLREVAIAASLDSLHVVRVLEVPAEDSRVQYLAMERLRGQSLAEILQIRSRLDVDEVVELLGQIGAGIAAAHRAGIVHRDLKPQNVFHHRQEKSQYIWKVLDFGVSKLMWSEGTLTGSRIVGTPGFMAPEQAQGVEVDHRTDLYALGVIAYRALTGCPAFSGDKLANVVFRVVHEMPIRPSSFPGIDVAMDSVLAVAMAKNPDLRFTHPDQLAEAVDAAGSGLVSAAVEKRVEQVYATHRWRNPPKDLNPGIRPSDATQEL